MRTLSRAFVIVLLLTACPAWAEPIETEITGVTAEMAELRASGGVLRLGVRFTNGGDADAESSRFDAGKIALLDVKSKQKRFPLKDAEGKWIAGPIGDAIDGGRIALKIPARTSTLLWAYFEPLPAGTTVTVEVPQTFPFEDVTVTEGAGTVLSATTAATTPAGGTATLVSMKRADQAVQARLKIAGDPNTSLLSPYFQYRNVFLFDPAGKRKYPLLKDGDGLYQGQPLGQKMDGGTFILDFAKTTLVSLTFQAPPDDVAMVDLVLPQFQPFEGVALVGAGGAAAGGIAAGGRTVGLEGALKELAAVVTPEEIKIDLAADVLFDFDKADLKPAAEDRLQHLLTVVNGKPGSRVAIEGHTDVRGEEAYNQSLSERRAQAVRTWLVGRGVAADRLTATGAGESRPARQGDTEADHQANRRVEIRIRN